MKLFFGLIILIATTGFAGLQHNANDVCHHPTDTIPAILKGNFTDDYGIAYSLNDSLFTQHPGIKYHIVQWNVKDQYFIAKNDAGNPSEPGLYSRIDYMYFQHMEPYQWGFCLTVYDAASDSIAINSKPADRAHPMKGCGGFPFSRMKKNDRRPI